MFINRYPVRLSAFDCDYLLLILFESQKKLKDNMSWKIIIEFQEIFVRYVSFNLYKTRKTNY